MLPKFPDKQRRPGIIHLPQPLATPPHPTSKLPALNPSQKQTQTHTQVQTPVVVRKGNPQLRTPSPSASPRRQPHSNNRRKQKRSSVGNIVTNINIPESAFEAKAPLSPLPLVPDSSVVAVVVPRPGLIMLSPPPTPAVRASNKSSKRNAKNKAHNHVRNVSKPPVLPVSPPLTPEAPQVGYLDY